MRKYLFLTAVICSAVLSTAYAEVKMVWRKTPINIVLPIGAQRLVSFPEKVAFGESNAFLDKLSVQNDNKTLYFTAKQAFAPHQFVVKTQSNKAILLNISAQKTGSNQTISVVYPQPTKAIAKTSHASVSLETLMRYAIQQYYAPKRLLHTVPGIEKTMTFSGKQYDLYPDGSVTAIPLASYSGGGLTVTAVYLKNSIKLPVDLLSNSIPKVPSQATALCGQWTAVSFFPQSKLMPAGSRYDSSMMFLVSSNDFVSQFNSTCGESV